MKTPFKKLRGLGLHKHNTHRSPAQLDELSQASQDMHDMKDCYDSLLSAAAATANSAYEFSESLQEMGDCLLEKTSLNDDEDSGRVLLMLGKVQFEIQKLVDNYRAHVSRTITAPSESLLSELRVVEDMKRQCDEKRMTYEEMKMRHKEKKKGGSVKVKGENVSSHEVRAAQEEFNEGATLFVFRMKSLKKGQSRSLLTQAARHHAAQMCFFRKALKSLEAIDPHVKLVTEQQYIDYQFSGLEDDDRNSVFLTDDDDDDSDDDDQENNMHEDGELSFEYQRGDPKNEVSSSDNSMELESADITFPQVASVKAAPTEMRKPPLWNSSTFSAGSKSAPLSAVSHMDRTEKFRQMRQSSARKLNTYVLPTPLEKSPTSKSSSNNLWHSSPLVSSKDRLPGSSNTQSVLKEINSNSNSKPTPLPSQTLKRYAFSGPLAGSGTKLSYSLTGSFVSSPKISELHELPRPPANLGSMKPPSKAAFSAPLVSFRDVNASPPPPQTPVSIRNT